MAVLVEHTAVTSLSLFGNAVPTAPVAGSAPGQTVLTGNAGNTASARARRVPQCHHTRFPLRAVSCDWFGIVGFASTQNVRIKMQILGWGYG
jgi:hypothetical protein